MSRRSDRKWREKDAREDAGLGGGLAKYKAMNKMRDAAETASKRAHEKTAVIGTPFSLAQKGKTHKIAVDRHVRAMEAHKSAAMAHSAVHAALTKQIGNGEDNDAVRNYHLAETMRHNSLANAHEQAAIHTGGGDGTAWDESKHPRDENGKFS